jgi:hypothetical protein
MTDATVTHTADAADKLAATRAELRDILHRDDDRRSTGHFPRSATMRALTSGGAMSALALVGVALLATRPSTAGRLARAVPVAGLLRHLGLGAR